jgi:hypothetical protein
MKTTVAILLVSIFDYKFINEMMNEVEKAAENARNSGLLPGKSNQVYEIKLNNCCNCIVNMYRYYGGQKILVVTFLTFK